MKKRTEIRGQLKITLYEPDEQLATLKEASAWASKYLKKEVSESNISYLVQYGKVRKFNGAGQARVSISDLQSYYDSFHGRREIDWKEKLGIDLNWGLSFDHLREKDTTKHVHRLHPYKGKFIPQLVQYFLDDHTDSFKPTVFFKPGDIILDPFSGSGTTLVQANELGMHSIGIDVSVFNNSITLAKMTEYDINRLRKIVTEIRDAIVEYERDNSLSEFEARLVERLSRFNAEYFPSPQFKYDLERGLIEEDQYAKDREREFLRVYRSLVREYGIQLNDQSTNGFLDKWYIASVRDEIDFALKLIRDIRDKDIKLALMVMLSRTVRSCRATTHSDLATLKEPQITTYYCWKHKKICKPLFSIRSWFDRYSEDSLERIEHFAKIRTDARFAVITGDSRKVDIATEVMKVNRDLYTLMAKKKIKGVFSSPPYVGQIDYHDQHAYAYELFGLKRRDDQEIGPMKHGQGLKAKEAYVHGIAAVLRNCAKFLADDFSIFLVANDKHNLYDAIADLASLSIVNRFKRPVLNRTERDKSPYAEMIFHMKSL